ncbi:MAG: SLC13 family permease [Coriobacteriales bacterium]
MKKAVKRQQLKRSLGAVGGIVVGLLMALFVHPDGLGQQGCYVLAILAAAIVWWICAVLPEFATALIMVALFALVGQIPATTSFSFFSNPIWWLLVGAFAIGLGMKETGLLKRMALAIVSRFPSSFAAQVIGFYACGTVLGPLIPSMAAKASLLAPLAMEVGDIRGYRRQGREATGLFLAMFTGVQTAAPAFISSSIVGYTLLAIYPEAVQAQFDFVHWFVSALPWFIPMTILNLVALVLIYRPRAKDAATGEAAASSADTPAPGEDEIMAKRRELGSMSLDERRMSIITAVTVLLWVTQSLHGMAAWIPAVGALVAMTACGIINKQSFGSGIGWSSLVFIGIVLGLGDVFAEADITEWIVAEFTPLVMALANNPYLLVIGIALLTIAARFLIVSQTAFINIFLAFVIPIAMALGINPWVIGMASYAVINTWFVKYQNPVYLAAFYSIDGKMAKHGKLAEYCVLYTVICIICLLIAVPFWQMMGIF